MFKNSSTNHYSLHTYNATILDVDLVDLEFKLEQKEVRLVESSFSSIQRYDIKSGTSFVPPITNSPVFKELFDEVFHLSSLGVAFAAQGVYLLLKKEEETYETILSSPYKEIIRLKLKEEQYKQMVKTLLNGGMRQIAFYTKQTKIYYYEGLNVYYKLSSLSQMPSLLEVESLHEYQMVEGLALLGITINKAIINKPWKKLVLNAYKEVDREVLQFLI